MIETWVIVGGCPRSGTTMLGNFLGAADSAVVTPEAQFASEALMALRDGQLDATPEAVAAFIAGHWRFYGVWDMDFPDTFHAAAADGVQRDGPALVGLALRHVVQAYADRCGRSDATIWIDHTPEHAARVPWIEAVDLDLAAVHLIRDGRAIASSVMRVDWGPNHVRAAADWWTARLAEVFAARDASRRTAWTSVRFEDLLADPETWLQRVCESLPLDYAPQMVTSTAFAVPSYTRGQHAAVGTGVQSARSEGWRTELSPRDLEIFEARTGRLLEILGYPRLHPAPRDAQLKERLWTEFLAHPFSRRVRKRRHAARRAQVASARGGAG